MPTETLELTEGAEELIHCGGCNDDLNAEQHGLCDNCGDCYATSSAGARRRRGVQCCPCSPCGNCGERQEGVCGECERCETCGCRCAVCRGCDNTVHTSNICCDCERCTENCGCACNIEVEEEPEEERRPIMWHKATRTEHKRVPSKRFVGVEIEVARADDYAPMKRWARAWSASVVHDGSLPSTGLEFVASPAQGDKLATMLDHMTVAARESGAEVDSSCGMHVHIDTRDYTYYDLRRLIFLYAIVEQGLFDTLPKSRRDSSYCRPCGPDYARAVLENAAPKEAKRSLLTGVYGFRFNDNRADCAIHARKRSRYDGARYSALNLHSFFFRGTVEFRMHSGTVEARKVVPWCALLAKICDAAYSMTESEVRALYDEHAAGGFSRSVSRRALYWLAPTAEVRTFLLERWDRHGGGTPCSPLEVN